MKKTMLFLALNLLSLSTFAAGDMEEVIFECQPAVLRPDVGLSLKVIEGGLAGMTRIEVRRSMLGHTQADNYIVKRNLDNLGSAGSAFELKGRDIIFSINLTTTPRPDHLRIATLVTKAQGVEKLLCKIH